MRGKKTYDPSADADDIRASAKQPEDEGSPEAEEKTAEVAEDEEEKVEAESPAIAFGKPKQKKRAAAKVGKAKATAAPTVDEEAAAGQCELQSMRYMLRTFVMY